jgi:hypothetical protein
LRPGTEAFQELAVLWIDDKRVAASCSLDEASAAFKRAYDAMREKAALPRP